jgi:antirestriction protein
MSVTLTSNYRDCLAAATVEKIDELIDENYCLDDMLTFIDEYNERAFVAVYEEYVRCGEAIGYEAVDALASEDGIDNIEGCDERYRGCYQSTADFAEHFHNEIGNYIPDGIEVDWEATWDRNLYYDFTACNDGSTYCPWHIFSDN